MTNGSSRPTIRTLSRIEEDQDLERRRPPVSLCLAGTVVVMNVFSTVLSLMA